ncbi:hypothetical protein OPV22_024422 [Ensete ventricosum]|uniref:Uncharacterized protein n=1 Tax=Ensete ventricosum TaxID=4639 RepID=A0AAV8Q9Z5_ENSVE|nr:hypothetical protein OPV22_024422 [Ensete ventricosum]
MNEELLRTHSHSVLKWLVILEGTKETKPIMCFHKSSQVGKLYVAYGSLGLLQMDSGFMVQVVVIRFSDRRLPRSKRNRRFV